MSGIEKMLSEILHVIERDPATSINKAYWVYVVIYLISLMKHISFKGLQKIKRALIYKNKEDKNMQQVPLKFWIE